MTDSTAAAMFMFMSANMKKNNTILVDINTMTKVLNKSEKTIRRAISTLKEKNFLCVIKYQRNNVYFINPMICCSAQAEYKSKLIKTYIQYADTTEMTEIDKDIVNSSHYDKEDKLTFEIRFYKNHKELQPPTVEELMDKYDKIEKIANEKEENQKVDINIINNEELPVIDPLEVDPMEVMSIV
jgi:hypothetical protein